MLQPGALVRWMEHNGDAVVRDVRKDFWTGEFNYYVELLCGGFASWVTRHCLRVTDPDPNPRPSKGARTGRKRTVRPRGPPPSAHMPPEQEASIPKQRGLLARMWRALFSPKKKK